MSTLYLNNMVVTYVKSSIYIKDKYVSIVHYISVFISGMFCN